MAEKEKETHAEKTVGTPLPKTETNAEATHPKAETAHSKAEASQAKTEKKTGSLAHLSGTKTGEKTVEHQFQPKTEEKKAGHSGHPTAEEKESAQKQPAKPKPRSFQPKLMGKWGTDGIQIRDYSLAPYINLESRLIPHSFGRSTEHKFEKSRINVVERLINRIMRSGQGKRKMSGKFIRGRNSCGKKIQAMQIVEKALEQIERETNQNPVQVLINAIENVAVREDTTRIKKGGVAYTVAVDVAPMRRVDEALKNLALSGFAGSFNKKVAAHEALAKEIILAAKGDANSVSIKRRDEVERIAVASR